MTSECLYGGRTRIGDELDVRRANKSIFSALKTSHPTNGIFAWILSVNTESVSCGKRMLLSGTFLSGVKPKKAKTSISRSEPGGRYEPVKLKAYVGMWVFLNTSKDDFERTNQEEASGLESGLDEGEDKPLAISNVDELQTALAQTEMGNQIDHKCSLAMVPLMPNVFSNSLFTLSSIEGNLFSYFITSISPSFSLSPSNIPYLAYLTPMSFQFPAPKDSLIAASANQLRLLNDRIFENEAWSYKNEAIKAVQRAVDSEQIDVGIVAAVLMLCFYGI